MITLDFHSPVSVTVNPGASLMQLVLFPDILGVKGLPLADGVLPNEQTEAREERFPVLTMREALAAGQLPLPFACCSSN